MKESMKLTGNGRWESMRMMVPEYREQYLALREQAEMAVIEPPTKEEMILLHDNAILAMIFQMIDANRKELAKSKQTLQPWYLIVLNALQLKVLEDSSRTKKALKNAGIYVKEIDKVDGLARYRYNCRGVQDEFQMTREYARGEITRRIGSYGKALFSKVNDEE
ncbi:hypothetical protein ACFOQM_09645 [Paenibacillus sp. GCM10012307]|uniref:Uncharacterized protein n=1 Tax=Paenibacillus roseus TaxID=2798579 RepID=A0A934J4T8_9BACL|nr:hypothetical protein [Paenibacillus roseus]MBJ6361548.1 hypothetical protein [Paenibacillus roseus]